MAACLIKDMRADKCFFGINGIDESFGYSTPRPVDAEMKTLMAASSVHSFMLADNTKFGKSYFAKVNVEVDYSLEMNYEHLAECKITVDIRSKEEGITLNEKAGS